MWAETYLLGKWADRVQATLDKYKYVITQDNIDWDRFYVALGQEGVRCSVTYEQGQWVVWIYPLIEPREERVIKMMEQAGFEIRKCE